MYNSEFSPTIGMEVNLKEVKVYPRYGSRDTNNIKTGKFYIWDLGIKNDRIRITKFKDMAKIPGQVTGWVDIDDLLNDPKKFKIGDKVIVSGNINLNFDGSGNIIYKNKAIMYVVDLLDASKCELYIGLANKPNTSRIGWGGDSQVIKYEDDIII